MVLCVLCLLLVWGVRTANGDFHESFESAEPTWRLADTDCGVRVVAHQRSFETSHSGHGSEHVRLHAGWGTYAHLIHQIPRGRVIVEWQASVWLWSDRPGVQFMARVVLPRSVDRRTGAPHTLLLRGDVYAKVGEWQQLFIHQPDRLLEREVRVLRSRDGSDVDPREAYIDLVFLNAYGGAGVTSLWIDDLAVSGDVPATRFATHGNTQSDVSDHAAGSRVQRGGPTPSRVQVNGAVLLVDGRPMLPRAIEHNGETFEWLKSLGFNTIKLAAEPSGIELREAERLGLWLVAPPPNDGFISPSHDRVLAWDMGSQLTEDRLDLTRQRIGQLRRSDIRADRPLIAEVSDRVWSYSRLTDLLLLRRSPLGSGLSLGGYGRWIEQRPSLARPGTPVWATIQTEPAIQVVDQWEAMGLGPPSSIAVEPEQLQSLCYQALASGARGLLFTSRSSLDLQNADTESRARALKHLNLQLDVIEPWIAAGTRSEDVESRRNDVRIAVLQTERAQLLIILRQPRGQQFTAAPVSQTPLSFIVPNTASSPQVCELTPAGLRPLAGRCVAGGVRVTLENAGRVSLLAVTQDDYAINHLTHSLAERKVELSTLQYEIAAAQLKLVESLHSQLGGQSQQPTAADEWLSHARSNLRHSELLLGASDHAAAQMFSERALNGVAQVRRIHWDRAISGFPSPVASPYCVNFASLPFHWEMAQRLQAAPTWSANALPAGDFESLEHIRAAGWQNISRGSPKLRVAVELSPESPAGGRNSLSLTAWPTDGNEPPTAVESPPIEIISAPVQVRRGQLVRIHGWVRVPQPIEGSQDGLMVYDSLGGAALAERIPVTDGWREIVLYRAAPYDGNVSVTLALTGIGEASVDDLAITLHESIAHRSSGQVPGEARRLPPVDRSYQ